MTTTMIRKRTSRNFGKFAGSQILSCAILAIAVLAALFGKYLVPIDPNAVDLIGTLLPPGSGGHLLGTDSSGRDTFARILAGAKLSLLAPAVIVVVSSVLGILLGLWSGWAGGKVDAVLSRVMDFLFAFPSLLIAMITVAILGPGLLAPTIGLVIGYIPFTARLVRSLVMQEKQRPYIEAYGVQGYSARTIATRMLLPNIAPVVIAQCALGFGYAVVDLAALSYLGLGVQPPDADWGVMVAQGQEALIQGVVWPVLLPSIVIVLVVLSVNTLSDGFANRVKVSS